MIPTPLVGDPDVISGNARTYSQTAIRLKNAARDLADLADDSTFISLAVDEIRDKAVDARRSTDVLSTRYEGAAGALSAYAEELRAAQQRAQRAIDSFVGSESERGSLERERDRLEREVQGDSGQTPGLVDQFLAATRAFNNVAQAAGAALAEYNAAAGDRDDAAQRAIGRINAAMGEAGLQDNFFESLGGAFQEAYEWAQEYLGPIIKAVQDALEVIAQVLSVITLIVSVAAIFLPFLAPLAGALQVLSLVVGGLLVLTSLSLFLLGQGSFADVLANSIGFALGVFTAGAGGAAIKGTLGAVDDAALALSQPVGTAGQQIVQLVTRGPASQVVTNAGAEAVVGAGEYLIGEATGAIAEQSDSDGWDIFPSAAGPSWNPPPTVEVEPVFDGQPSWSAVELVESGGEQMASFGNGLGTPRVLVAGSA